MAKHGTIGPFRGNANNWSAYTESLEQYFVANDVTEDAKKRAILLSACNANVQTDKKVGIATETQRSGI